MTTAVEVGLFFVVVTYSSAKRAGLPEIHRYAVAATSEDEAFATFERENPAHLTRSVSVLQAPAPCVRLDK
jgi:AMMECR1 domain-containing protein